jgi:hypothetical protein
MHNDGEFNHETRKETGMVNKSLWYNNADGTTS